MSFWSRPLLQPMAVTVVSVISVGLDATIAAFSVRSVNLVFSTVTVGVTGSVSPSL